MANPEMLLCGAHARGPAWIPLRAGPLAMQFDPETLALRRVRLGDREVLRCIYAAVRDRNWGTVAPRVENLQIEQGDSSFRLSFEAHCVQDEIDFCWKGTLAGERTGTVRFLFDGEARSTFLSNRIGICVLHPLAECAGNPCTVEHVDGSIERQAFPQRVSPLQPFKQVRALTHEVMPGVRAEVRFEGDTFETEDQRNWTDASFKTYSTPLELPFPVEIRGGSKVRQEVIVALRGHATVVVKPRTDLLVVTPILSKAVALAPIGLGFADPGTPLTADDVERLRGLRLAHLRLDVRLARPAWHDDLRRAATLASQLGAGLHVAVHLTANPERELDEVAAEARAAQAPVSLWMIFREGEQVTAPEWLQLARRKLQAIRPAAAFAAGTDAYFAELNRQRPNPIADALPCYSLNPQVHASDLASLAENVDGQVDTVETAFEFTQRPVVISPVTLRPRFNPNATAPATKAPGDQPPQADPRQASLFGAAWTLGSIAQLACTGHVHSLTYYETAGPAGIMESEAHVFPMFHVFAALAGWTRICPLDLPNSLRVAGLVLLGAEGPGRVLLGSFVGEPQRVRLRLDAPRACVRILHAGNAEQASRDPAAMWKTPGDWIDANAGAMELALPPFALASLDLTQA